MARKSLLLPSVLGAVIGAAAVSSYIYYMRPQMLRWGALETEVDTPLPGDELVPLPRLSSTHAITIETPPYRVWPWLVQMGQRRGGFYTYDWLENLMGLNIHSADRVLAMYQDLRVGDTIPLAPNGIGLKVVQLVDNQALVLHGDTRLEDSGAQQLTLSPGDYLNSSWGFFLFEMPDGNTRLIDRWRMDWNATWLNRLFYRAVVEPAAFIMRRGMLQGIKDRAEGRVVWETAGPEAPKSGSVAGLELGEHTDLRQPGDQYAGES